MVYLLLRCCGSLDVTARGLELAGRSIPSLDDACPMSFPLFFPYVLTTTTHSADSTARAAFSGTNALSAIPAQTHPSSRSKVSQQKKTLSFTWERGSHMFTVQSGRFRAQRSALFGGTCLLGGGVLVSCAVVLTVELCVLRRVTRPHGSSGVVKSKFRVNLPPRAFGASVRVVRTFYLQPCHLSLVTWPLR